MQTPSDAIGSAAAGYPWPATAPAHWSADGRLRMEVGDLKALRQSEAQYRNIVDAAPVGIILTDEDSLILLANPAFQQMIGYSADELRTRHFKDFSHPDDAPANLRLLHRTIASHRSGYTLDKRGHGL